jgi:hypothetical protein
MATYVDCGPPEPGDNAIPRSPKKRGLSWTTVTVLAALVAIGLSMVTTYTPPPTKQAQAVPASTFQPQSFTMLEITEDDSHTSQATIPGYLTFNDCVDASNELLRQKKDIDSKYSVVRPNMTIYCVPAATR